MKVIAKDLAKFIFNTNFDDFPNKVIEHAKLCILDWLGSALAGSIEPPAKIVSSIVDGMGGKESTVIGTRIKTSCLGAALANGVAGHVVELDDIHGESVIHPAAPVIPAALAIAERDNVTGKDLITSVILGYEVEIRIGISVMPSHYRFWHTTGTCGNFGAATAAGKILGLDEERMTNALGIAGTQASGLVGVFGTMSKPLNAGKAAMNGILASVLAQRGFTGPSTAIEEYCRATAEGAHLTKITKNIGKSFEITRNIFKIHASCGHTHGAIDAVLQLVKKYSIKAQDVDEILVGTYPIAVKVVGKKYEPKTIGEAKFSLPYCLAAAMICGKVGLEEFTEERLADSKILELSRKVKVRVDPKYAKARLGCAKVILRTKEGKEFSASVAVPKGYPKNPLSKTELERKFIDLAALALPEGQVLEIVQAVNDLEKLDEVDTLTSSLQKKV